MLYRSLVLGMLGAIALLVASPSSPPEAAAPVTVEAPPSAYGIGASLSVVDVSRQRSRDELLPLLGLMPGERIVAIGGIKATSTDVMNRWQFTTAGSYLDLAVRGDDGEHRRILVIAHL